MKYRSLLLISFFIFAFSFFIFSTTLAQGVQIGSSGTGIELTTSADFPTPGQAVTITARSYSIDINAATVTWTVNGKVVKKGVGDTVLKVVAPPLGKTLAVNVTVISVDGLPLGRSVNISSGSVDMIVEPDGYSPGFFEGKLPIVFQNEIKVVAVPHLANPSGVEYDPKTLIYKWKKNDKVLESDSGYGKQAITVKGDIVPRAFGITVEVTNRDNTAHAVGYQTISFGSPSLSFYVDDPLYGTLFNNAITDAVHLGVRKETGILAVPFGFNKPANGLGDLSWNWMINGIERPEFSSNESLILQSPGDSAGTSDIGLEIRNTRDILQNANSAFTVRFTADKNSNKAVTTF